MPTCNVHISRKKQSIHLHIQFLKRPQSPFEGFIFFVKYFNNRPTVYCIAFWRVRNTLFWKWDSLKMSDKKNVENCVQYVNHTFVCAGSVLSWICLKVASSLWNVALQYATSLVHRSDQSWKTLLAAKFNKSTLLFIWSWWWNSWNFSLKGYLFIIALSFSMLLFKSTLSTYTF